MSQVPIPCPCSAQFAKKKVKIYVCYAANNLKLNLAFAIISALSNSIEIVPSMHVY